MTSVIIPCFKEPYLNKTIESLLKEAIDDVEIIAVLDGCDLLEPIFVDPRVRVLRLGKQSGMRAAINAGVRIASGDFIMRTDCHCIFGHGYDRILSETCQPNWIMTARRYFLNPEKWEVMDEPFIDYERLVIQDNMKFAGQPWRSRSKERSDVMLDETMAMQGSVWFMPKSWWEKVIVELDDKNYGPHIQDSHEMQFKTWKAGGKLMLNKNTWFAHKHRSFNRTHNFGKAEAMPGYKYCLDTWRDYYEKEIVPKWA